MIIRALLRLSFLGLVSAAAGCMGHPTCPSNLMGSPRSSCMGIWLDERVSGLEQRVTRIEQGAASRPLCPRESPHSSSSAGPDEFSGKHDRSEQTSRLRRDLRRQLRYGVGLSLGEPLETQVVDVVLEHEAHYLKALERRQHLIENGRSGGDDLTYTTLRNYERALRCVLSESDAERVLSVGVGCFWTPSGGERAGDPTGEP